LLLGFNLSWVIGEKKHPILEGKVYSARESCPFVKPKCIFGTVWSLLFVFFFSFFSHCPALFRKEKVEGRVLAIIHSFVERWVGRKGGWFDRCHCIEQYQLWHDKNRQSCP